MNTVGKKRETKRIIVLVFLFLFAMKIDHKDAKEIANC
jgi:hypothetical protein